MLGPFQAAEPSVFCKGKRGNLVRLDGKSKMRNIHNMSGLQFALHHVPTVLEGINPLFLYLW